MNKKIDIRIIAVAFMFVAIVLRLVPHAYNMAAVGALGLFVGCYWSARMGFLISLAAMAISDMVGQFLEIPSMGFYSPVLMLTVYGAVGCAALVGKLVKSGNSLGAPLWLSVPLGAVAAAGVFFLITNFASWLDPQMNYPKSFAGLMQCYAAAIPFAKNSLIGNLLYSAAFFGVYATLVAPASAENRADTSKAEQ